MDWRPEYADKKMSDKKMGIHFFVTHLFVGDPGSEAQADGRADYSQSTSSLVTRATSSSVVMPSRAFCRP